MSSRMPPPGCSAPATTTDGILSESEAEDEGMLAREPDERTETKPTPVNPEAVKRRSLEKNLEVIQSLKQHLAEGTADTAKFRNQLLKLLQGYYIKSKKASLSEAEIAQLREQKALAIVSDEAFLNSLCRLAHNVFLLEQETRFAEPDGVIKKDRLNLLTYVVTICQNYSDQSHVFAAALSRCSFALRLYAGMQTAWAEPHLAGELPELMDKRLRQTLSTVYNMLLKGDSEIFFNLKEHNFVETARPYLKSQEERFRFSAFLVLVFSCNEEEASRLLIHETSLAAFLVRNLRMATSQAMRRSGGYHVIELAKCAYQFTKNEQNKAVLVESGILPVLSSMLQATAERSDEVPEALKILLSLSFDPGCCAAIKEQCGPELKTLRNSAEWKGNRDLDAIRFKTEGGFTMDGFDDINDEDPSESSDPDKKGKAPRSKKKKRQRMPPAMSSGPLPLPSAAPPPPPPPSGAPVAQQPEPGHLMISYHQHSSGEFVRWMRSQLASENFKANVWVDYEQMQDSTLDCMAKAVEGSAAILMCVCKGYKDSDYCRMEAEYAIRQRKLVVPLMVGEDKFRADGWLGFIMGTKLYYKFSGAQGKDSSGQSLNSLVCFLKQRLQPGEPPVLPFKPPDSTGGAKPSPLPQPPRPRQPRPKYTLWDSQQVASWLLSSKLPSHLEPLGLEGRHLSFLVQMRGQAPEAFYRLLQKSLKLSMFHELYDFVDALDQLSQSHKVTQE